LSIEKLCPVLSFYIVKDWRQGCERCKEILRYGGMGHTMSIHSKDDAVILEFGLKKPAFRIIVNSPTTLGSIGLTTGLDPAMTLGCGGYGGNITSDNISPKHLLNIKRLAYELTPVASTARPAAPPAPAGITAEALAHRVEAFLGSRGYRPAGSGGTAPATVSQRPAPSAAPVLPAAPNQPPLDFVCEEDVRLALRAGRKLVVSERAIVTPAARELGEEHHVFSVAP
jgi:acetaldehyde dehydrogenase (acetylating)